MPLDGVVDPWTSDNKSSSLCHFLCRQDVWMMFRRQIGKEITSTTSMHGIVPRHPVESGCIHCGVSYQNTSRGSMQGRPARCVTASHHLRRSRPPALGQHTAWAGFKKRCWHEHGSCQHWAECIVGVCLTVLSHKLVENIL